MQPRWRDARGDPVASPTRGGNPERPTRQRRPSRNVASARGQARPRSNARPPAATAVIVSSESPRWTKTPSRRPPKITLGAQERFPRGSRERITIITTIGRYVKKAHCFCRALGNAPAWKNKRTGTTRLRAAKGRRRSFRALRAPPDKEFKTRTARPRVGLKNLAHPASMGPCPERDTARHEGAARTQGAGRCAGRAQNGRKRNSRAARLNRNWQSPPPARRPLPLPRRPPEKDEPDNRAHDGAPSPLRGGFQTQ